MDIKLGEVGKIVAGQDVGSYVKVIDDTANTGGFLIVTTSAPDMQAALIVGLKVERCCSASLKRLDGLLSGRIDYAARGVLWPGLLLFFDGNMSGAVFATDIYSRPKKG